MTTKTTPYAVIYTPWQGEPRVYSRHRVVHAAQQAARRYTREFQERNPNSYGPTWQAAKYNAERGKWASLPEYDEDLLDPAWEPEVFELLSPAGDPE